MKYIYKGKNVRSAINKGLKKLNLSKDEVSIEIVQEKPMLFFGLLGGGTRVRVKPKDLALVADWDKSCEKVRNFTEKISNMIVDNANISVKKKDKKVYVDIDTKKSELIIGKRGTTLQVIEYILNLVVKRDPSTRVDVRVDCAGYRNNNVKEKISEKVKKASEKVKKTKKAVKIKAISPEKRKFVHNKVKKIKGLKSEDSGSGRKKDVIIKKEK